MVVEHGWIIAEGDCLVQGIVFFFLFSGTIPGALVLPRFAKESEFFTIVMSLVVAVSVCVLANE